MKSLDNYRNRLFFFFQFFFLFLKFDNLLFLFQISGLKLQQLYIQVFNLYLKFSIFLLKRYHRLWWGVRGFYLFAVHGVLQDVDLSYLYDDTQRLRSAAAFFCRPLE